MINNKSIGFLYLATGKQYIDESLRSSITLRKHHPEIPICLITDDPDFFNEKEHCFNQIIRINQPTYSLLDKIQIDKTPYDKTIFIDTDTICIEPIDELFALLEKCDLVIHQNAEGYDYDFEKYGLNIAMPEFNTGLIGFNKKKLIETNFFKDWESLYNKYKSINVNDQLSFRILLYNSSLRYCTIPSAYNFFIYFPAYTTLHAKIIHGRPFSRLEEIAKKINQTTQLKGAWQRCYFPELNEVITDQIDLKNSFKLTLKLFIILFKNTLRSFKKSL